MALDVVPKVSVRTAERVAHAVVTVVELGVYLVVAFELRRVLNRKAIATKIHVGELASDPYRIDEVGLGQVGTSRIKYLIVALGEDILMVGTLVDASGIRLGVFQDEHILLCAVAQLLRLEERETFAVDYLLGGCSSYVEQLFSSFLVTSELLPCTLIESHTRDECPGCLLAQTAIPRRRKVTEGRKFGGSLVEVIENEIDHFSPVISRYLHTRVIHLHRFLHDDGVTIELHQVEITVSTVEMCLTDILLDATWRSKAFCFLQQDVRAINMSIVGTIVTISLLHGVGTVAVEIAVVLVGKQV